MEELVRKIWRVLNAILAEGKITNNLLRQMLGKPILPNRRSKECKKDQSGK